MFSGCFGEEIGRKILLRFLGRCFPNQRRLQWLSAHTALQIIKITWKVEHPVVLVCRNIIKARPILPFSRIQTLYSVDGRQMIWIALQASGEGLETRLQDIIGVLNAEILDSAEMSTPKFLDALADAVIFTSEAFSHELRHSAIKCLLDHCVNSRRWEILHQVFSFDSHVQRLIFTTLRDKLSQEELCDFVRAYPTDSAHISDLFLLLSGWAIGLQSYSQDGSRV
ncbi:hypothetical protein B0H13DRAFT_1204240 [Mycena leptocephala]|nr:hypothetical protein B0H13DRAFT_1204240 [Mycena leptocephala]